MNTAWTIINLTVEKIIILVDSKCKACFDCFLCSERINLLADQIGTANFLNFYFEFIAVFQIQLWDSFDSEKKLNDFRVSRDLEVKYKFIF